MRLILATVCLMAAVGCRCEEVPIMPIKEVREAAEKGDALAQRLLSQAFLHGCGVKKDAQQALEWAVKAGQQGDLAARTTVVFMRQAGIGTKQDYAAARTWFVRSPEHLTRFAVQAAMIQSSLNVETVKRASEALLASVKASAEKGDAFAQCILGVNYRSGISVKQDAKEALKWLLRAAQGGDSLAQFFLGEMYEKGDGVAQNEAEALRWMGAAARQGNIWAALSLGQYHYGKEQMAEARKWLTQAAEADQEDAQALLGILLTSGLGVGKGVEKDSKEGFRWLRAAAETGHPQAQWLVGGMLIKGDGTPPNEEEGAQWLQKATAQGVIEAMSELGVCYYIEKGVRQDPVAALRLLVKAAEGGSQKSRQCLTWLADDGLTTRNDKAKEAFDSFLASARKGDPEDSWVMFYWLSCSQKEGVTPEGKVTAERFLRLAAQAGNEKAKAEMAKRGLK